MRMLSGECESKKRPVRKREEREKGRSDTCIFRRLSLHHSVFSVNSRFEVEGSREETGISPNQPHTPSLSININTSSGGYSHARTCHHGLKYSDFTFGQHCTQPGMQKVYNATLVVSERHLYTVFFTTIHHIRAY